MKAVVCSKYGPPEVLRFEEVEKPVPKDNEVLVKVYATTVHIGDTKIRRFEPGMGPVKDLIIKMMMRIVIGFKGPRKKILGMELAGVINAVGKNVTRFKVGDSVLASTEFNLGAYAEYCCVPEDGIIAIKPESMSFEEAAPFSNGAITALLYLRRSNLKPGQKILIYGASGSVGTFAVQLAKYYGAEVTAVCSTANMEMVKSLGADKLIDYTHDDFTNKGESYDVIFDTVGKIPPSKRKIALAKSGVFLNVLSLTSGVKLKLEDLLYIIKLYEAGKLRIVIDKIYPMEQIIEAHRYVDQGHKKGNVVITIGHTE